MPTPSEEQLIACIEEMIADPPIDDCAVYGVSCALCHRTWKYRHATRGGNGIIHRPDCLLVRLSLLLNKEAPAHADKD